jgi:hypothetical protein
LILRNEEQAIAVIAILIESYRWAFNHNSDYEPIEKARSAYCEALKEYGKLSEDGLHIIYLKGKIRADEAQLQRHKLEVAKLLNDKGDDVYTKKLI